MSGCNCFQATNRTFSTDCGLVWWWLLRLFRKLALQLVSPSLHPRLLLLREIQLTLNESCVLVDCCVELELIWTLVGGKNKVARWIGPSLLCRRCSHLVSLYLIERLGLVRHLVLFYFIMQSYLSEVIFPQGSVER